jgi:hypothetical protein
VTAKDLRITKQESKDEAAAAAAVAAAIGMIKYDADSRITPSSICTVCLETYKVDDFLVWSHDKNCPHAFHKDCIVQYFSRFEYGESPCPCCRRTFCTEPNPNDINSLDNVDSGMLNDGTDFLECQ